ncbi:51aa7aaa-d536-41c0-8245-f1f4e8c32aa8 [Sclerotinia trifoliorum]|uniref:51aa7aaa-d536-41c0-8245-f1f4e8c32aa8 n=1 Tax=Sclerotinia trifoliorum TaxID=28548 RepID=A0A8H2W0S1_9HELO|nr:51aa7aaa-d536-41c0-8245-f1f4e8c32aa8 [Sclerotinia trifoliorum]
MYEMHPKKFDSGRSFGSNQNVLQCNHPMNYSLAQRKNCSTRKAQKQRMRRFGSNSNRDIRHRIYRCARHHRNTFASTFLNQSRARSGNHANPVHLLEDLERNAIPTAEGYINDGGNPLGALLAYTTRIN